MKVMISGAGIAGLTLAYWLRAYGFTPVIVERSAALVVSGYKIDVRGSALDVLRRGGIHDEVEAAGTHMQGAILVDRNGDVISEMTGDDFGHRTGADLEIVRGSLCRILQSRTTGIETIFGATIDSIAQSDNGAEVTLSSGETREVDLVVGADGLHSRVRRLAFGEEDDFIRNLGMYLCVYSVPNEFGLDRTEVQYSEIGRVAAIWATGDDPDAKATFGFAARSAVDRGNRAQEEQAVSAAYEGVGWEVPRLLELMPAASDWYFDIAAQIEMPEWARGRVALVGDAAYCASPMSGQGASLALVGAYVLAGELAAAGGDLATAFHGYHAVMRPFVAMNQELGRRSAALMTSRAAGESSELTGEMVESIIDATTQRIADAAQSVALKDYSRSASGGR